MVRTSSTQLSFRGLDDQMPVAIPAPYRRIATLPELRELASWLGCVPPEGVVAIDVETRPWRRDLPADGESRKYHSLAASLNEIIGVSLSFRFAGGPDGGVHAYVPIRHDTEAKQLHIEQLRPLLERLAGDERLVKVAWNAKFELNALRNDGIELRRFHCAMMMASLIDLQELPRVDRDDRVTPLEERLRVERPPLRLKELAVRHVDREADKHEKDIDRFRRNRARRQKVHIEDVTYDEVPIDRMVPYAASDSRWALEMYSLVAARLAADPAAVDLYATELALIPILADMEYQGARLDRTFLEAADREHAQRIDDLRHRVHEAAGDRDFDPDSPRQLVQVFQRAGIEIRALTEKGAPSLVAEELERLAAEGHPLARATLEYREVVKAKGTYLEPLLRKMDERGYIHCSYRAHGARTGRLSSGDPNLQNIPEEIRAAFIPPDGWLLVMIDYSQVELRMLAHCSRDRTLLDAFERGEDVHRRTAVEMFGLTEDAAEMKARRKIGKTLNFAVGYGAGPAKVSAMTGKPIGVCRQYLERFYGEVYPGVATWKREQVERASETGIVRNLYGRVRRLPILQQPRPAEPRRPPPGADDAAWDAWREELGEWKRQMTPFWKAERIVPNTIIQGTCADIFKESIVNVADFLAREKARTRIVLNVHDELAFYVPRDETGLVPELKRIMEEDFSIAPELRLRLVADVSWSDKNWRDKQPGLPA